MQGEKDVQERRSWTSEENKDLSQTTSHSQARQAGKRSFTLGTFSKLLY